MNSIGKNIMSMINSKLVRIIEYYNSTDIVTVTSRVVALALGLAPIGVIKRASRLND